MRDNFQLHYSAVIKKDKPKRCPKLNTVHVIKMHDDVWKTALQLSQGDMRRIQILSAEEVIIHNSGKWERSYTP